MAPAAFEPIMQPSAAVTGARYFTSVAIFTLIPNR